MIQNLLILDSGVKHRSDGVVDSGVKHRSDNGVVASSTGVTMRILSYPNLIRVSNIEGIRIF